jgi:hypothetical protein
LGEKGEFVGMELVVDRGREGRKEGRKEGVMVEA